VDLLRLRRHLPGLQDLAVFVAEQNGDLPCVLRENRFFSTKSLFHRYQSVLFHPLVRERRFRHRWS
jgi:hypothetical protein